jgi:hypothetical protein
MLTPGEFVVNRRGVAALNALNEGRVGGTTSQTIEIVIGDEAVGRAAFKGLPKYARLVGA